MVDSYQDGDYLKPLTRPIQSDHLSKANIASSPHGWIGRQVDQPPVDGSTDLVLHLNYLMVANTYGNRPGDEARFDETGNFILIKEEPISASAASSASSEIEDKDGNESASGIEIVADASSSDVEGQNPVPEAPVEVVNPLI